MSKLSTSSDGPPAASSRAQFAAIGLSVSNSSNTALHPALGCSLPRSFETIGLIVSSTLENQSFTLENLYYKKRLIFVMLPCTLEFYTDARQAAELTIFCLTDRVKTNSKQALSSSNQVNKNHCGLTPTSNHPISISLSFCH
jgi:hypothetical protein